MLWYLSTPSEMPLKEPDFQEVNTSPFLEVKACQLFLHCWAQSLMLEPNKLCSAARNIIAWEMVWPWQSEAVMAIPFLRLSWLHLWRSRILLDRVSASCMQRYNLLCWSQHLCTAALCRAVSYLEHSTLSKTWAYLAYLKHCGYGVDITSLQATRRTSSARYWWAYQYMYFCSYESQLVTESLSSHTQKAHTTSAPHSEMEWALLSMG